MEKEPSKADEMRLEDDNGRRLYLSTDERADFLEAASYEKPVNRMFCHTMHYTGCRPTEARELVVERVIFKEAELKFRSLKKRKLDKYGNLRAAQYRYIPVPGAMMEHLDLVFSLRVLQEQDRYSQQLLWPFSRPTAYRLIDRVMRRADIVGPQATARGLRHAFGIAMLTGAKPLPLHVLAQIMGHTSTTTTECYLRFLGPEKRKLVLDAWER